MLTNTINDNVKNFMLLPFLKYKAYQIIIVILKVAIQNDMP
ncbi:hypothetical protein GPAL_1383 [Glaciecola pallidula DSM 14239 = ACAM 615]|uniref:Uncharacterized protein n=1 Tax=Brumicola pallidula DSM 14239 = ACAM 615 TaxID=1121922 RepID=K6YW91_9ALTE|nr:hypothetical protein GPAL_1383 [Glaciecola pallidula DSM 14239 = ACAM 615]